MLVATVLCALTNGAIGGLCLLKNFLQTEESAEIISWVLAVLIMVFMFLVGISMTGFPWILMGKFYIQFNIDFLFVIFCTYFIFLQLTRPDLIINRG